MPWFGVFFWQLYNYFEINLTLTNRVHAIEFAELAAANFLRAIHPAKVAEANSANAVLAGPICSAKTVNSRTRLTIIHSGFPAMTYHPSTNEMRAVKCFPTEPPGT